MNTSIHKKTFSSPKKQIKTTHVISPLEDDGGGLIPLSFIKQFVFFTGRHNGATFQRLMLGYYD
jgi:hypothetical protein